MVVFVKLRETNYFEDIYSILINFLRISVSLVAFYRGNTVNSGVTGISFLTFRSFRRICPSVRIGASGASNLSEPLRGGYAFGCARRPSAAYMIVSQRCSIKEIQALGTIVGFMFTGILGLLTVAGCYFIGLSQFMW